MSKKDKLVKAIGDEIIDRLFELENEYEYEGDEYGFYSASYSISFDFKYGNSQCNVGCSIWWNSRTSAYIECFVNGGEGIYKNQFKNLDCIEKAVQEYVENNLDCECLLDAMEDDLREFYEDEWEQHGFRDAADYYHWRYG